MRSTVKPFLGLFQTFVILQKPFLARLQRQRTFAMRAANERYLMIKSEAYNGNGAR